MARARACVGARRRAVPPHTTRRRWPVQLHLPDNSSPKTLPGCPPPHTPTRAHTHTAHTPTRAPRTCPLPVGTQGKYAPQHNADKPWAESGKTAASSTSSSYGNFDASSRFYLGAPARPAPERCLHGCCQARDGPHARARMGPRVSRSLVPVVWRREPATLAGDPPDPVAPCARLGDAWCILMVSVRRACVCSFGALSRRQARAPRPKAWGQRRRHAVRYLGMQLLLAGASHAHFLRVHVTTCARGGACRASERIQHGAIQRRTPGPRRGGRTSRVPRPRTRCLRRARFAPNHFAPVRQPALTCANRLGARALRLRAPSGDFTTVGQRCNSTMPNRKQHLRLHPRHRRRRGQPNDRVFAVRV